MSCAKIILRPVIVIWALIYRVSPTVSDFETTANMLQIATCGFLFATIRAESVDVLAVMTNWIPKRPSGILRPGGQ